MKRLLLTITITITITCGWAQENRGFIHPGGLHTQEDFTRIKQLLADQNAEVTEGYNNLISSSFSQSSTYYAPSVTVVRGGSGENYINCARAAGAAYQQALRWKIDGDVECAEASIKILNAWAKVCKNITGDSNQNLARGLYGYEFAQAAELMRDYEGWNEEDFKYFQKWMLDVWYPGAIDFLRRRCGTWENSGKWWQAPGHYWSNWPLSNALTVISIGILCDDVFIYNQGMSFFKYDQVGTFHDPKTADNMYNGSIKNDGLTEFLGNLVVTTHEWDQETGAYGKVGQMNESGRDTGHCGLAVGLAVDLAHTGWNQGDDLFSYMDHRLAAGIEYVAAQTQSAENLPWDNYYYITNGIYCTDSRCWNMTAPALPAQIRSYWGTVIGHYEGVKGVTMPWSEKAYADMGVDGGCSGSTSGGYDHLGYSVLMNARASKATVETAPTELTYSITCDGSTIQHNELGGLVNTYKTTEENKRALAQGTQVTLSPAIADGTDDTGIWEWNTGEKTREITITANKSFIYRATYTNAYGVKSYQAFPIAVQGDCQPTTCAPTITIDGLDIAKVDDDATFAKATVYSGSDVTLALNPVSGYGNFEWSDGSTASTITLKSVKANCTVTGCFISQGGKRNDITFHIIVTDDANVNKTEHWLPSEDGWTKLSEMPANAELSDYYYVVGEKYHDIMLGISTAHEEAHTSIGTRKYMQYFDGATPYINTELVWTVEANNTITAAVDSGIQLYSLRNVKYSDLLVQTEYSPTWLIDLHDQPNNCTWTAIRFIYDSENDYWHFHRGINWDSNDWLWGDWDDTSARVANNDLACNKVAGTAGVSNFEIYAIKKDEFTKRIFTKGDVNCDNVVNIADITCLISYLNGETPASFNKTAADIDGDGSINIFDITALKKILQNI